MDWFRRGAASRRVAVMVALSGGLMGLAGVASGPAAARAKSPDLVERSVTVSEAKVSLGGTITVTDVVANVGKARSGRSLTRYYLSKNATFGGGDRLLAETRRVRALPPGKSSRVSRAVTIPAGTPAGAWRVVACSDDTSKVRESREANNCRGTATSLRVEPGNPPITATVTLDSARAVTRVLPTSAGTISATGADGTVYTLTLPAHALVSPEAVTLTPITAVSGTPVEGPVSAGVDLAPNGLILMKQGTLSITPASPIPVAQQIGFSYTGDGEQDHLYPLDPDPSRIVFHLDHFCGEYLAPATPDERAQMQASPPSNGQFALESEVAPLTIAVREGETTTAQFSDQIAQHYESRYPKVKALMEAAASDADFADDALLAGQAWVHNVLITGLAGTQPFADQSQWIVQAFFPIWKQVFDEAYQHCLVPDHPQAQAVTMSAVAHEIAILDGGDPSGTLGDDWSTKLSHCQGEYRFQVHGTAGLAYASSAHNGFLDTKADFDAVNVPLHVSTICDPLGGCFKGSGDLNVTNVRWTSNPAYAPCTFGLPPNAGGTASVAHFIADLNPGLPEDPDELLPPRGIVAFTVIDSEQATENCGDGDAPHGEVRLIGDALDAAQFNVALQTGAGAEYLLPAGTTAMAGTVNGSPGVTYDVSFEVAVTRGTG